MSYDDYSYWEGNTFYPNDYRTNNEKFPEGSIISGGEIYGNIILSEKCRIEGTHVTGKITVKGNFCSIKNIYATEIVEDSGLIKNEYNNCTFSKMTLSGIKSKIERCTVNNAIYLKNGDNIEIDNCTVYNNGVHIINSERCKLEKVDFFLNKTGIYMKGSNECECNKLYLRENEFPIQMLSSTKCKISKSQIVKSKNSCFIDENSKECSIEGSVIKNCSSYGIQILNSEGSTIYSNEIYSNKNYGIYIKNSNETKMAGNTIYKHGISGIYMDLSENVTSISNKLHTNYKYGIKIVNCTSPKLSEDEIFNSPYGIYYTKSLEGSFGEIIKNCDIGIYANNCSKVSFNGNRISKCLKIGLFLDNIDNGNVLNNEISKINQIKLKSGKTGEYKLANIDENFFDEKVKITEKCSIGIVDINGSNTNYNCNIIQSNIIGLYIENTDKCNLLSNYIMNNEIGILFNKSKKNKIKSNTIIFNERESLVFYSNLEKNPKLCISNVIDSNIIGNPYIYYNEKYCYINDSFIPNNSYFISPIETITKSPYKRIDPNKKISIIKGYWNKDKMIPSSGNYISVAFLDTLGGDNGEMPIKFKTYYLASLMMADLKDLELNRYNIFFFKDSKQNLVIDNYMNDRLLYINENLDLLIRTIKKDEIDRYEFLLKAESALNDEAKDLRKASKEVEDNKTAKKIESYFNEKNKSDSFIKNRTINPVEIGNKPEKIKSIMETYS